MKRDRNHEGLVTALHSPFVLRGVANRLSAFAGGRADRFPAADRVEVEGRDFVREVAEELADARNYAVWSIQAGVDVDRMGRVLGLLVETWAALGFEPASAPVSGVVRRVQAFTGLAPVAPEPPHMEAIRSLRRQREAWQEEVAETQVALEAERETPGA